MSLNVPLKELVDAAVAKGHDILQQRAEESRKAAEEQQRVHRDKVLSSIQEAFVNAQDAMTVAIVEKRDFVPLHFEGSKLEFDKSKVTVREIEDRGVKNSENWQLAVNFANVNGVKLTFDTKEVGDKIISQLGINVKSYSYPQGIKSTNKTLNLV